MIPRATLVIIGLTFLAFFNTLSHDFTGDAYSLFVENHFYENSGNMAKIFTRELLATPESLQEGFITHSQKFSSGLVSYRPVTALSFFLDYGIWGMNPFGYYLMNLVLHIIAALLVYSLALTVSKTTAAAFLAAVLFGIHPVQAEVVNSIGYRSDSLVVVFYLAAILAYRQFRIAADRRRGLFLGMSLGLFFLALFSKESALTLPFILLFYDYWFLTRGSLGQFLRRRRKVILAYAAIYIFYVYVYFQVMANEFYSHFRPLGNWIEQGQIMAEILFRYLSALFLPWQVDVLPPLYAPPLESIPVWHVVVTVVFILGMMVFAVRRFAVNRIHAFGVLWFLVTYLPTANILTLLNPFAFRFLYLPSVGFFIVAAWGIDRFCRWTRTTAGPWSRLGKIFPVILVAACLSVTISLNFFFKNNFVLCREMVRNYPDSSRPYWILGLMYFKYGDYDQALVNLRKYLEHQTNVPFIPDPRKNYAVYHMMGRCYVDDPDQAIRMFNQAIALNPNFSLVYADLAKAYILKNDFQSAVNASLKAIALKNDLVIAYVYAVHSYLVMGDTAAAGEWMARATAIAPHDSNLHYLKEIIARHESQPQQP